jgi:CzcA family heavy metal efflux pump
MPTFQKQPSLTEVDRNEPPIPWVVRHAGFILFATTVLAACGVYLTTRMPIALFPETDFPRIVIALDNGSMAIDQMEIAVTNPVENAVNAVPGLQRMRSTTSRGSAEINLFFDAHVDMFQTLQLVDGSLAHIRGSLPPQTAITTHRLTFATFPILGYSLSSETVPPARLWEIATYDLKPSLSRLDGVSSVDVQGEQIPDFEIVPDPASLIASNVTIGDIQLALERNSVERSSGLVQTQTESTLTLVGSQAHSAGQLQDIVIKSTSAGIPIHIGDIASVHSGIEPVHALVRADGKPAVLLSISRQPASNIVAVTDEVSGEIDRLKNALPPGTTLSPFYDQSEMVRSSMRSVRDAIVIGLLLSVVTIFLFLRDWRSAFVAALVIPATLAITVIVLYFLGSSFNLMTLGGLTAAIGLVIDDAIVVVESIVRCRAIGEGITQAIRRSMRELALPLVGSTLTPLVVFLPLIAVPGVAGGFFRTLALTMTIALFTSLVLALSWTPALSAVLLAKSDSLSDRAERPVIGKEVSAFFQAWLAHSLVRPRVVFIACGLLAVATLLCYRFLGSDLLPEMDEGAFVLDYAMPPGTSLTVTDSVLKDVELLLENDPDVDHVSRRTGLQMGLAGVTENNTGDLTVKLKTKRDHSMDEVIDSVRAQIHARDPLLRVEFTQVLQDMVGDLSSAPEPIEVKLSNPNPDLLASAAESVAKVLRAQPGLVDVQDGLENTMSGPANVFTVKPTLASQSGFTTADFAIDAAAIVEGEKSEVPLVSNGHSYPIRIRFPRANRESIEAIRNTVVLSPTGHLSALGDLAAVEHIPSQPEIIRENLRRTVVVTARLQGADLGSAMKRVKSVVRALNLPREVHVEYGGGYKEQQESFSGLAKVFLLALVLVFAVLLAEFRNFAAPAAILATSLLSITGALLGLLLCGMTFNVPSFIGLILTIGIVAKNGILLLDAEQRFRSEGLDAVPALLEASRRRLRPILMTALAAILGMLPLALALGNGAQLLQPLAIATIGSLVLSIALSLIVTPCLYSALKSGRA